MKASSTGSDNNIDKTDTVCDVSYTCVVSWVETIRILYVVRRDAGRRVVHVTTAVTLIKVYFKDIYGLHNTPFHPLPLEVVPLNPVRGSGGAL